MCPPDGFLVLGHDVDRYSPDDTIPVWDKYGFEKMQSFSGAMSQLNFWRQWIPDTQIKDMAFCKGAFFASSSELFVRRKRKGIILSMSVNSLQYTEMYAEDSQAT